MEIILVMLTEDSCSKPKLSIIVPCYNSSYTIDKCIKSILFQDYQDFELIIVDDGSTDNTESIVSIYTKIDTRIRYFKKENAGVSSARNFGIEMATGMYLGFCDSDDYIEKNMYQDMIEEAESNSLDIVVCDFFKIIKCSKVHHSWSFAGGCYYGDKYNREYLSECLITNNLEFPINISACTCLIKRDIVIGNNIRFDVNLKNYEDYLFGVSVSLFAKSISYLKGKYLYNYVDNLESASKVNGIALREQSVAAYTEILKESKRHEFPKKDIQLELCRIRLINQIVTNMITSGFNARKTLDYIIALDSDLNILTSKVPLKSVYKRISIFQNISRIMLSKYVPDVFKMVYINTRIRKNQRYL